MKSLKWHNETMYLKELIRFENEAKEYSEKDIEFMINSIKENGIIEPLVVNTNGEIINGHLRYYALREVGRSRVKVTKPSRELTRDEHLELYLRLNRNIAGVTNFDILREHFTIEEIGDAGLTSEEVDIVIKEEGIYDDVVEEMEGAEVIIVFKDEKDKQVLMDLIEDISSKQDEYLLNGDALNEFIRVTDEEKSRLE